MPDSGEKTVTERSVTQYRFLGIDFEDGDEVVEVLVEPTTDRTRFRSDCATARVVDSDNEHPYDEYRIEQREVTYGRWWTEAPDA